MNNFHQDWEPVVIRSKNFALAKIKKPMTQIIGGRFSYGGFSNGDDLRIRGVRGNMGVSGYISLYFV